MFVNSLLIFDILSGTGVVPLSILEERASNFRLRKKRLLSYRIILSTCSRPAQIFTYRPVLIYIWHNRRPEFFSHSNKQGAIKIYCITLTSF